MNKIRELREENNWTQDELGQRLNVKRAAISKYESEKIPLTGETLRQLSEIFNVSTDYILGISNTRLSNFISIEKCTTKEKKSLSPEKERLIKEIQQASDDDLKEMEYILNYLKSKKEKNEDAATIV